MMCLCVFIYCSVRIWCMHVCLYMLAVYSVLRIYAQRDAFIFVHAFQVTDMMRLCVFTYIAVCWYARHDVCMCILIAMCSYDACMCVFTYFQSTVFSQFSSSWHSCCRLRSSAKTNILPWCIHMCLHIAVYCVLPILVVVAQLVSSEITKAGAPKKKPSQSSDGSMETIVKLLVCVCIYICVCIYVHKQLCN